MTLVDTNLLLYASFTDVELAALAIEHGLVLASHDSGFRRFPGLRTSTRSPDARASGFG